MDELEKHLKEKDKKRLRRIKNIKKDKKRKENIKNGVYRYGYGWYLKDWRLKYKYKTVEVPAKTVIKEEIVGWKPGVTYYKENGEIYSEDILVPIIEKRVVTIPKHNKRIVVSRQYENIEPYLKRINISKKYHKKCSAKKARKTDFPDGSGYKKIYDIEWAIW